MRTATDTLTTFPARYFDAWNGRDAGAAGPLLADEFEWVDPLLPAPLTSVEGARGFLEGGWLGFPDLAFTAIGEPLVDEANGRVAQEWRMTGTHQGEFPPGASATGKPFDITGTDVFTIDEDGRATAVRAYYDVAGLMRQLGLA